MNTEKICNDKLGDEGKQINSAFVYFTGAVIMGFIMLLLYGKDESSFVHRFRGIAALVSILLYVISNTRVDKYGQLTRIRQMVVINALLATGSLLVLIDGLFQESFIGYSDTLTRGSVAIGLTFVLCRQLHILPKSSKPGKLYAYKFHEMLNKHLFLYTLLALVSGYLIITYGKVMPMWDSALSYQHLASSSVKTLFDIKASSFYAHISYAYTAVMVITNVIFRNMDLTIFVVFSVTFIISICCFYGIVKIIVPEKNDLTYSLAASIYAFSPFTLGMIHDTYQDLFSVLIFTIIIYLMFSHKTILTTAMICFYMFIKEPAFMMAFYLLLGQLIIDIANMIRQKSNRIGKVIFSRQNLICVLFAVIWMYTYLFISHWSKENGDGTIWTSDYLRNRCKVIFCLNFNWIIAIGMVICIIYLLNRHKETIRYIVMLMVPYIGMLVFLIVFPTHNHARYLGAMIVPAYILCASILCEIDNRNIRATVQTCLAVLILVSSFRTIDPVTKSVFPVIKVGSEEMITTGEILSDSLIYNAQYEGYQKVMNKAVTDILKTDPDSRICLPAMSGYTWFSDALGSWQKIENVGHLTEYWNPEHMIRHVNYEKGCVPIEIYFASDNGNPDSSLILDDGQVGHLLYAPYVYNDEKPALYNNCKVISEKKYNAAGWQIIDVSFMNR